MTDNSWFTDQSLMMFAIRIYSGLTGLQNWQFISLLAGAGVLFGIIAALMLFVVTYGEYIRHFPEGSTMPWRLSVRSAMVGFVFFFLLSLLLAIFLV